MTPSELGPGANIGGDFDGGNSKAQATRIERSTQGAKPVVVYVDSARYSAPSLRLLEERFEVREVQTLESLAEELPGADVLIASLEWDYPRRLFESAPRLRFVVSNTTGVNHIDLPADSSRPELIFLRDSSVLAGVCTTAELTFLLILSLLRRLRVNMEMVATGGWDRYRSPGVSFARRRVGIIGLGRLGRQVASYCGSVGMAVSYYDPYVDSIEFERCYSLEDLVGSVDVVSVHARLTEETTNLIDDTVLSAAKTGLLLVNTARGEILDEESVARALDSGVLGGLAVDVLTAEQEQATRERSPLIQALHHHSNVIITPHIGGSCPESRLMTERIVLRKLLGHYSQEVADQGSDDD